LPQNYQPDFTSATKGIGRSEGRIDVRTDFRDCQLVNDLPGFNR